MRSFFHGLGNLRRWLPLIWRDRDWDWEFLARVMEFKLRRMAHHENFFGHHVGSKLDARNQLVCAELLKRLRDDDYYLNARKFFDGKDAMDAACRQQRSDQRYLGLLLGKYLTHWRD